MPTTLSRPAPQLDADERIYLSEVLACRLDRQIRNLHVEFLLDGLVLDGQAPCYYTRRWAEEEAEQLTGLPVLFNNIVIS